MHFPTPAPLGITVFSKTGCAACVDVIAVLLPENTHILKCDSFLACNRHGFIRHMSELTGGVTRFPLIFKDGKYVGCSVDAAKLLTRSIFRLFPIQDADSWRFYEKQRDCFWTVQEVDFSSDGQDISEMKPVERNVLLTILGFFASSDAVVNEQLVMSLYQDAPSSEARMYYSCQIMIEAIHQEMYNKLLETMVRDSEEQDKLFNAIVTMPCVSAKANWYIDSMRGACYPKRLIIQAIVEGVFFSSSFAYIFYLKQKFRGKFQGLVLSNDFIARDEGLHRDFSIMLYNRSQCKMSDQEVHALIDDAVRLECDFVKSAFMDQGMLGLNSDLLCDHVRYVSDHLLVSAGHPKKYKFEQPPLPYMENLSLEGRVNFFESRVSQYSKMNDEIPNQLEFNAEF